MILINGERREHITSTDRGFQYGDGLFETIEIHNRQPIFLQRHLKRLNSGCTRLHIPIINNTLLCAEIKLLIQQYNMDNAVLKIIITRGTGGRGYRLPDNIKPTRLLSLYPFPNYPSSYLNEGINTKLCQTRLGLNPQLAGIKHLNRLEQILARAEWQGDTIQEGIVLDINDNVIEGTMSNLFYSKNDCLYTADLNNCGIKGIMRDIIIELAQKQHISVNIQSYNLQTLLTADEVFVCNSIIGLWQVKQIDNTLFNINKNSLSQQIRHWLLDYKNHSLMSHAL